MADASEQVAGRDALSRFDRDRAGRDVGEAREDLASTLRGQGRAHDHVVPHGGSFSWAVSRRTIRLILDVERPRAQIDIGRGFLVAPSGRADTGSMPTAGAARAVDWVARYDELSAGREALGAEELDELGLAAWFLGREADSVQA